MKKQRKLVIGLLLVLALVVSGFTFAYWASSINVDQAANEGNEIQIGEGEVVQTSVSVTGSTSSALDLVPVGREVADVSVSSITYTFDVLWDGTTDTSATGAKADLTVTPALSGAAAAELLLFTVTNSHSSATEITYGSTTTVTITVTFTTEPANAAQYDLIANKALTLTVAFALGTVTPA